MQQTKSSNQVWTVRDIYYLVIKSKNNFLIIPQFQVELLKFQFQINDA